MTNTNTSKQTATFRLSSTLFIIALAFSFSLSTAQTAPLKQWDARFGGSDGDGLFSLAQTADGGYILGGQSYSGISGDKTQTSQGSLDYWIVKTDANGVKQWDARFGGSDEDDLSSLVQTADGGYLLGGYSYSGISGDKTQASRGGWDYWIVKTDANGVKQWDKRFGGSDHDFCESLAQTADGGYILGGYSLSGISGDKTQASQGGYDYWIVKTDASGGKQWDKRFGGSSDDYLSSIAQTADGGYILGGYSYSGISGDKTQASQGLGDYWIVKTDANGVKQWDKRFGGSEYDYLHSLAQTADGGYILGGYSYSGISGDKTQANWEDTSVGFSTPDYWIVKTDASGVKQWDARFGGSDGDELSSLAQTADGGYILGGYSFSGISGDKTQRSQGYYDYWIVKTDANGVKQWDKRFGGSDGDELFSLAQTADGGYILGGGSWSGISGDKTQASQGLSDYWVVKVAPGCSGGLTVYADADGDGYGDISNSYFASDCVVPAGYVTDSSDCNDDPNQSGASINPGASEVCDNSIDENCNGQIDENCGGCEIPITLTTANMTATSTKLKWNVMSEAIGYKVRYKIAGTSEWTITQSADNNKTLNGLDASTEYAWQVKSICGVLPIVPSDWSEKQFFTTDDLRLSEDVARETMEVYPNPVSQSATISFFLTEGSSVMIELMDVNGRSLRIIVDADFSEGNHDVTFNRESLSAGIYFLQMKTNEGVMMKKVIIE